MSGKLVWDEAGNHIYETGVSKGVLYPMSSTSVGHDEVFVGRIRKDFSVKHGINMWVVADNLRKGAASNAIQIMERMIEQ